MINLINKAVQDDLYDILTVKGDQDFWIEVNNNNEYGIMVRNNDTISTFYPYPNKLLAEGDYFELKKIKNLCKQ